MTAEKNWFQKIFLNSKDSGVEYTPFRTTSVLRDETTLIGAHQFEAQSDFESFSNIFEIIVWSDSITGHVIYYFSVL